MSHHGWGSLLTFTFLSSRLLLLSRDKFCDFVSWQTREYYNFGGPILMLGFGLLFRLLFRLLIRVPLSLLFLVVVHSTTYFLQIAVDLQRVSFH